MNPASFILSSSAHARVSENYRYAQMDRRMGVFTAMVYATLALLVLVFFRLESPAVTSLRARWRPWFAHLSSRPYRWVDPIRYLVQAVWLIVVRTDPRPRNRRPGATVKQWCRRLKTMRANAVVKLGRLPVKVQTSEAFRRGWKTYQLSDRMSRMLVLCGLLLVIGPLGALLITQPFSLVAQAIFVALLWVMALIVRRIPSHFSLLMLMVLSVTVSARYMWWRYTSTLNLDSALDGFFGIMLLMAETYSYFVLLLGYVQVALPLRRQPAALPSDTAAWPTVDLMIPTYSEDLSVVKPTVYAALGIDWPQDKLRIHLLDDGRRTAFRDLAAELGVNYIVRSDNRHAKAGNLNHALGVTDGELVAIFDCDHIPTRSFLQMTVGWFLRDSKMALVQTPHHFFSPDPFERNLGNFRRQPNENTLFYGLVQDGNDLWNAAFFCGSCAVLRRSALDEIGGIAVETVTEDAHTALRLHRKGYNSAYLRIPQAAGLATESLSAHIGQRIRWARGMIQIFRTDNPLLGRGLSLFQRLCYTNAMLHFLAGVPRIIYLTSPLAFLLLHSYILYAPALAIVLYVLPHMAHSVLTNSQMQGSYRRSFWGEIYETVLAWYIARPTTVALISPAKGKFNVTSKGGLIEKDYYDWGISHPYVMLALANIVGLLFGVWRLFTGPQHEILTVLATMLWVVYNLIILGGAIAVAAEVKQIRHSHRVPTRLRAMLQLNSGHLVPAVLSDFSEGGAGITLRSERDFELNERVDLVLMRADHHYSFPARVSRHTGTSVGLRFEPLSVQQHINLVQCTFARADSWLISQNEFAPDKPFSSLQDVLVTSYRGYVQLGRRLPFPFSLLPRLLTMVLGWLSSMLPRISPQLPIHSSSPGAGHTHV